MASPRILFIACGALARELVITVRANGWDGCHVKCLPASLHNRPDLIPGRVEELLRQHAGAFDRIFVGYGDCGTGGQLDAILESYGAERFSGAHCYEFYAGPESFSHLMEAEPGTFFLTDFLVKHFDRLVVRGLGLDRHPQLRDLYFAHYRKVMYLAQSSDKSLQSLALAAADALSLDYEYRFCGLGTFQTRLVSFMQEQRS